MQFRTVKQEVWKGLHELRDNLKKLKLCMSFSVSSIAAFWSSLRLSETLWEALWIVFFHSCQWRLLSLRGMQENAATVSECTFCAPWDRSLERHKFNKTSNHFTKVVLKCGYCLRVHILCTLRQKLGETHKFHKTFQGVQGLSQRRESRKPQDTQSKSSASLKLPNWDLIFHCL